MSSHTASPSKGAASIPSKFPSRKDFQGLVAVIVGPSKKEFTVHRDLLSFYSDYYRAAFSGNFSESTASKIELLDVKEGVFEDIHTWLYMRKLVSDSDEPLGCDHLVDLWIFGDRFQTPMLQNCVMDELVAKCKRGGKFRLGLMKVAYKNTVDGSPLRKVMIERLAYKTCIGDGKYSRMGADFRKYFTVEILQDLVKELDASRKRRKIPSGQCPKRDKCYFHVHGKDEHC